MGPVCFANGSYLSKAVRVHVIGLTGGIASGKSTVSAMLVENGAALLDADLLGHRTYQPGGSAYGAVVERFGRDILSDDRTIDRHIKRLRKKFKAVDPDFDHIETLYGVGYRYRGD